MAHMMKKAEFLNPVKDCGFAHLKTFRGSVYLYNREISCRSLLRF